MAMNKEERKARIEILKKLLDDDGDLLEASNMIAVMLELYTLVHEDLIYGRNDLQREITDIRAHRTMAINAGCDDDLLEKPIDYCGRHLQQILKWLKILRPLKVISNN